MRSSTRSVLLGLCAAAALGAGIAIAIHAADAPVRGADGAVLERIAALGRIEPHRGVYRVAGPPRPAVVIDSLAVEEGDRVVRGQVIAVLQGIDLQRAERERFQAELAHAEREVARLEQLRRGDAASTAAYEAARLARDVARANRSRAEAELALSQVRAPIEGQILKIHAREGERVGPEGVVEIGETASMYAVAEVYETDVGRVRTGQRATITSPAFAAPLGGAVERIGLRIGRQDVLRTDPVADADARVVEVEIRLDDSAAAAHLTNLRVDVQFEP